jgi:1-aminocyclopropane-1-carboxylate deaminase
MSTIKTPSRLQRLPIPALEDRGISFYLKREDELHPLLGGNKWRKLRYNLEHALQRRAPALVTFGGHLSNHIVATAATGKEFDLRTVGYVRDSAEDPSEFTRLAQELGMEVRFVGLSWFRDDQDPEVLRRISAAHPDALIIPEGAANQRGLRGAAEVVDEIDIHFTHLCCAVGTGGTLAGLVMGLGGRGSALGIAGWRGEQYLAKDVEALLLEAQCPWRNYMIDLAGHLGGFGRSTPELEELQEFLWQDCRTCIDLRFTGKMILALIRRASAGYFAKGDVIIALHNGLPATMQFNENQA